MKLEEITVRGSLSYGHIDELGVVHRDFEMHPVTMSHMEEMLSTHPEIMESGNWLARRRLTWSYALIRLGTLAPEDITPELLANLPMQDWDALSNAEDAVTKKLKAAYERPASV